MTSPFNNDWNPKTKELSDLYFDLAQIPSVSSASFIPDQSSISVIYSQRDVDNNTTTSFIKFFGEKRNGRGAVEEKEQSSFEPVGFPVSLSGVELHSFSPSGKYLCLFKRVGGGSDASSGVNSKPTTMVNYQIEIWDHAHRVVLIPVSDVHGRLYTDIYFSRVCWTRDESTIFYLAEYAEKPKSYQKVFWDKDFSHEEKSSEDEKLSLKISGKYNFENQEEWGELLVGAKTSRIYKCNWADNERSKRTPVLLKGIESSIAVSSPQLTPDEKGMIFSGYNVQKRRLGIVYCFQRQNDLYHLKFASTDEAHCTVEKITPEGEWNILRPVFSPDGSQLIYLTTGKVPYHNTCKRLMSLDWETKKTRVIVDYVNEVKSKEEFPGLYPVDLAQNCFTKDSRYIYVNSCWGSLDTVMRVEIATGKIQRVKGFDQVKDQSLFFVTNTVDDRIIAYETSPNLPYKLFIGKPDQQTSISEQTTLGVKWTEVDNCFSAIPPSLSQKIESITWQVVTVPTEDKTSHFECIVQQLGSDSDESRPLLIMPHGGPHSTYTTMYMMGFAYYILAGFKVCEVNYRGSLGFGMNPLKSIVGKCGRQDVSDVYAATMYMFDNFKVDRERVAVIGGSHGGFLAGHMIGQYPELFRAGILLNPVTNISSMISLTDIPDWSYTEANGVDYEDHDLDTFHQLSESERENILLQQYKASPQSHVHKVNLDKCAVLILLGEEDKRVPPMGGREFYYSLKKRCTNPEQHSRVQLHVYPKNSHPISSAECEADRTILSTLWLSRFL